MGSWYRGNDPASQTGNPSLESRVYCEAMYQINECEQIVGLTPTSWAEIGSYPATDAIVGYAGSTTSPVSSGKTWLTAMQAAIETVCVKYAKSSTDHTLYTLSSLLTAAIGKSAWTSLTNQAICDGTAISEVLKAIEKLTHPVIWRYQAHNWDLSKTAPPGGGTITPSDIDDAHTQCEAQSVSAEENVGWATLAVHDWTFVSSPPTAGSYYKEVMYVQLDKGTDSAPSKTLTKDAVSVEYKTSPDNTVAQTAHVYVVSSSEYSTHSWSAVGSLLGTVSVPSSSSSKQTAWMANPTLIEDPGTTCYLQFRPQDTTPLPNISSTHKAIMGGNWDNSWDYDKSNFRVTTYCTFTHTYG